MKYMAYGHHLRKTLIKVDVTREMREKLRKHCFDLVGINYAKIWFHSQKFSISCDTLLSFLKFVELELDIQRTHIM